MPECTRIFPSPPCCWTQALSGQSQFLGRLGDYMETKNCSEYTNHLDCFKMYWDDWGNWKPAFRYLIKSKNRSTMYTCVSRVWIICIQVMSQNYRRHCWRTDIIKMTTNPTTYFFIIMWNGWTCLLIGFFSLAKDKITQLLCHVIQLSADCFGQRETNYWCTILCVISNLSLFTLFYIEIEYLVQNQA